MQKMKQFPAEFSIVGVCAGNYECKNGGWCINSNNDQEQGSSNWNGCQCAEGKNIILCLFNFNLFFIIKNTENKNNKQHELF